MRWNDYALENLLDDYYYRFAEDWRDDANTRASEPAKRLALYFIMEMNNANRSKAA